MADLLMKRRLQESIMPPEEKQEVLTPQTVRIVWWQWLGVLLLTAYLCWPFVVAVGEMFRRGELTLDLTTLSNRLRTVAFVDASDPWQVKIYVMSALYASAWLVLFPLAWLPINLNFRGRLSRVRQVAGLGWTCAAVCGATAFAAAYYYGRRVQHLPPLYGDEYGYIFLAETFLQGCVGLPTPPEADLFTQRHILLEPLLISKYFPGAGLWLASFFYLGLPRLGWWLFAGLTAAATALIARRHSLFCGYAAGFGVALAPGIIMLSQSYMSTMPSAAAIALFALCYLESRKSPERAWLSLIAGFFIGLAFVTRPVTAIGIGAPFALHATWSVFREARRLIWYGALVAGFAPGLAFLLAYNAATTGDPLLPPQQLYNKRYTPSHQYGFYNRERGLSQRGPQTRIAYDDWAKNITPALGAQVTVFRLRKLLAWTLSPIPIVVFGFVALTRRWTTDVGLLLGAVAGLAAAYTPFWFTGVLGFGYVAEALPFVMILTARGLSEAVADAAARHRGLLAAWWLALPACLVYLNLVSVVPGGLDPSSDFVAPRLAADRFRKQEKRRSDQGPIVVLLRGSKGEEMDPWLMHNHVPLTARVIRLLPRPDEPDDSPRIRRLFPNRRIYRVDVVNNKPTRWTLVVPTSERDDRSR